MDKAMELIIKNIYTLADLRHIPIKMVEQKAGLSVGYLSRLKRDEEGGNKLPVGVIKEIADILKVALYTLLFTDISTTSDAELIVIKFLNRLTEQTIQGAVGWRRVGLPVGLDIGRYKPESEMNKKTGESFWNYVHYLPIVGITTLAGAMKTFYQSLYYNEEDCRHVTEVTAFTTRLPDSEADIFVVKANYPTEVEGMQDVLECYIYAGNVLNPIRKEYYHVIDERIELNNLYEAVADSFDRPKLQPKILEIMQTFTDGDGSGPGKGERKLKIPDNMMHEGK